MRKEYTRLLMAVNDAKANVKEAVHGLKIRDECDDLHLTAASWTGNGREEGRSKKGIDFVNLADHPGLARNHPEFRMRSSTISAARFSIARSSLSNVSDVL
jgi:hypothetical protein